MSSKYDAAIDKGIELLDEKVPGWLQRINLEALDIESFLHCVLGEACGDWGKGLRAVGLHDGNAHLFGFRAPGRQNAVAFTQRWRERIAAHYLEPQP